MHPGGRGNRWLEVKALLFYKGKIEEISGTSWLKGAIEIAGALWERGEVCS